MGNTVDEIKLLDAEIEKERKEIIALENEIETIGAKHYLYSKMIGQFENPFLSDKTISESTLSVLRANMRERERNRECIEKRIKAFIESREGKLREIVLRELREEAERLKRELREAEEFEPEKQGRAKDVIPFPTPPGTQWHEVKISFIDRETVKINIGGKTSSKTFIDMGFKNKKNSRPVKAWDTFFNFGEEDILKFSQANKDKTEKTIENLNKKLIAYFGIQDKPIIFKNGYRAVFKVCEDESRSRSVYAHTNSEMFNDKDDD